LVIEEEFMIEPSRDIHPLALKKIIIKLSASSSSAIPPLITTSEPFLVLASLPIIIGPSAILSYANILDVFDPFLPTTILEIEHIKEL